MFPRVKSVFEETFDRVEEVFPDLGTIELHLDEKAASDNGAGAERQFAYCKNGNPLIVAFAAKAEKLPLNRLRGLMRHEFGHALEYRYGVQYLEDRLGQTLPTGIERRADVIAEAVWNEPIEYDTKLIQCVRCNGQCPRPKHLPEEDAVLKKNPGRGREWYFASTPWWIEATEAAEADDRFVDPLLPVDPDKVLWGERVGWDLSRAWYVVEVPVEKILFMEDNMWNFEHAAALVETMRTHRAPVFDPPAARLYRIDEERVASTQAEEVGETEYQSGMERPWEDEDAGTFYVQLLDGNHRALAAIVAGESTIPVIVGENYRDNVRDDEWVSLE